MLGSASASRGIGLNTRGNANTKRGKMKIKSKNNVLESIKFGAHIEHAGEFGSIQEARFELAALLETIASQLHSGSSGGIIRSNDAKKIGSWAFEYRLKGQADD